jgi:SAM-dependent methyltransferase
MKRSLLARLRCNHCSGGFEVDSAAQGSDEITTGTLRCVSCHSSLPVHNSIPRFVGSEHYAGSFGYQWNKYADVQLDSRNGTTLSRDRFYSITEWKPADLADRWVLDLGCGAGRFAEIAIAAGAHVVAVDLSRAVDACVENLRHHERLHVLQASITELPLLRRSFDFVYSIGVVQHTPNPKDTIVSALEMVTVGGEIGLWIYERDWKSYLGTTGFKYALRPWTKQWSIDRLQSLSDGLERICWPLVKWSHDRGLVGKVVRRLLPVSSAHLHGASLREEDLRDWIRLDTFDMYSPSYDFPQRYDTVEAWIKDNGFAVHARHPHGGISMTAKRVRD